MKKTRRRKKERTQKLTSCLHACQSDVLITGSDRPPEYCWTSVSRWSATQAQPGAGARREHLRCWFCDEGAGCVAVAGAGAAPSPTSATCALASSRAAAASASAASDPVPRASTRGADTVCVRLSGIGGKGRRGKRKRKKMEQRHHHRASSSTEGWEPLPQLLLLLRLRSPSLEREEDPF